MKTLYLFLFITTLTAQENYVFNLGIDPKLAISGAYDYDNSPVYDLTFQAITEKNNNGYGLQIEYANLEPFYFSTGLIYNRKIYLTQRIETFIGTEIIIIQRGFRRQENIFASYGFNLAARFRIIESLGVGLRLNYKRRPDLVYAYDGDRFKTSGYVEINYIIERW